MTVINYQVSLPLLLFRKRRLRAGTGSHGTPRRWEGGRGNVKKYISIILSFEKPTKLLRDYGNA